MELEIHQVPWTDVCSPPQVGTSCHIRTALGDEMPGCQMLVFDIPIYLATRCIYIIIVFWLNLDIARNKKILDLDRSSQITAQRSKEILDDSDFNGPYKALYLNYLPYLRYLLVGNILHP